MRPRLQMVVLALAASLLAGGLTLADSAQAANGYTTGDVNMRTGPGVNYPRIAVIPRGAAVTIRGCVRNHRWCDVSWRGWRGWVSARYLAWTRYRRPIYRPGYPPLWGGPIIQFRFERYHDRWYRGRPYYRKRHWHPDRRRRVIRRDYPIIRHDRPTIHRHRPIIRRHRPIIRRDHPIIRRDRPIIRRDRQIIRRDRPIIRRDRPTIRHHRPIIRRDHPIIRRDRPIVRRDRQFIHRPNLRRLAEQRERRLNRQGGAAHKCIVRRGQVVCR